MKFLLILITILFTMTDQADAQNENYETAVLGAGCFWCVEAVYQRVNGVVAVESGYAGGHVEDPTYNQVVSGKTGHAEVAKVTFDPEEISFEELLEVFWHTHDPTTLNRQGADVGTQYRSIILYHNDKQKEIAEQQIELLEKENYFDKPIVTEVKKFEAFYPAEDYHQDFYKNNPTQGYCRFVIKPKLKKLQKKFDDKLKNSNR